VVASGAGGDFLFRCLDSLGRQARLRAAEVIVVDRCGDETRDRIREHYPWVRVASSEDHPRPSVPELRARGVDAASAEIVAVIEEHCVAPPGWMSAILESFSEGDSAIGGPILDSEFHRLRDWVVYFSEYHNYLPPWPPGERYALNGANIAYSRQQLIEHRACLTEGYWEVVLHPRLAERGRMRAVPAMGVHHTGPFDYGYYLRQRYLLSRVWGGTQRDRVGLGLRMVHLGAAPIFPFFLLARIAQRVAASGQHRLRFLCVLPLLFPAVLAYTWGEWLGYLVGPGNALQEVE
jgi:hypothetical protein